MHFKFQANMGIKSHPAQDTIPPFGFSLPFSLER